MWIEYYALVELKGSKYYGALAMLNVWNPAIGNGERNW